MGPKYPVVDPAPSMDTVTANFGFGEYVTWLGLTAVSVPLGYAAGASINRTQGDGDGQCVCVSRLCVCWTD